MTTQTIETRRIQSIDVLRGIVMVIMALDHVRDFFHDKAMLSDPLDLSVTTPGLFFTRWITHFCAPVFVFLSGLSAYLSGKNKDIKTVSRFLVKRGSWLVLAEVLIITLGLTFNPLYNLVILQVIWAIGSSMIILGILVNLPYRFLLVIGLVIVFGHNLLDYPWYGNAPQTVWWKFIHGSGYFLPLTKTRFIMVAYAFMPWAGVMITGYCFGRLYERVTNGAKRVKILALIGIAMLTLFLIFRLANQYGDPRPWKVQQSTTYTILSFLDVTKYPPSLMYLLVTIGTAMLLLSFLERAPNRMFDFFITYGRVPFFYYILHFYLIHTLCVIAFFLKGYRAADIVSPQTPFLFRPAEFGFSLPIVYLIWITVVLSLYPACVWYNKYKATHNQWWLRYL